MPGKRALILSGMKRCNTCLTWQPESTYRRKKAQCNDCLLKVSNVWRRNNPNCIKKYQKTYQPRSIELQGQRRETLEGRCKYMMNSVNSRIRKRNEQTDLTSEFLRGMFDKQNMKCAQTGLDFDFTARGKSDRSLLVPTLDRIDSTRGYTRDNVQIVVWFYNAAKCRETDDHVWSLMEAAVAFKKGLHNAVL